MAKGMKERRARAAARQDRQLAPAPKPARVWIEIEQPTMSEFNSDAKACHIEAHRRAKLLSEMLRKLGYDLRPEPCWWFEEKWRYCFVIDSAGGFVTADDSGHWFDLEYMAKPASISN